MRSRHKKHTAPHRKRPPRPEDAHMVHGDIANMNAYLASVNIDAADDRQWLRDHPDQQTRFRRPSIREIVAFNLPLGITVAIQRGPMGSQIRAFMGPKNK